MTMRKLMKTRKRGCCCNPSINIIHYFVCACLAMLKLQIFTYPRHKMIFEGSFDDLVKEIGGEDFVNVGSGEVKSERNYIVINAKLIPELFGGECIH